MLELNTELAKENNRLLKKLVRQQVRQRVFKFLYWLIIVGVALGTLYYLKPFFVKMNDFLTKITTSNPLGDINQINNLIKQVSGKK